MKPVLMFMTSWCSFCRRAFQIIDTLREENDAYNAVEITVVDEDIRREYADTFDYYFVPAFFIGDKKVHEGIPTKEKIQSVFEKALAD